MHTFDRRSFLKSLTAVTGASILTIPGARAATAKARVVVVGGGFGGASFGYDSLVASPGVDFDFSAIQGLTPELAESALPHAWKAGPQTLLLKKQLEAMPDGGRFIISVPKAPFRCPPGPYERAAQVAMHCLHHGKKKAKILILDANDNFSKRPLFEQAWKALYGYGQGGMIEWVSNARGAPWKA